MPHLNCATSWLLEWTGWGTGCCSPPLDVCVPLGFPSCGERASRSLQGSVLQSPSSESQQLTALVLRN